MKWISQHIWDFISRFRSDVYLESVDSGTIASGGNLGLDSNNKIVKATSDNLSFDGSTANGVLTYKDADEISVESEITFNGNQLTLEQDNSGGGPTILLQNNHVDANPAALSFYKYANGGTDNDQIGNINFYAKDDANGLQYFAQITGSIADATNGEEAGKLELKVCEFDGSGGVLNTTAGLTLDGDTDADGEVDVTIGAGAASTATIAGTLTMGSTAFVNNSGVVQVATQGTIDHDSLANFVANEHIDWTASSAGTIHATNYTNTSGWHGSTTRIKILHRDFIGDDGGRPLMIDDTGSGSENFFLETFSTFPAYATVAIPTGYAATHVMIYGSGTGSVEVWEHQINSKTGVSKGTGNVDTEIDITDVTSSTTNYLFIGVNAGSDELHGGYVTIAAV